MADIFPREHKHKHYFVKNTVEFEAVDPEKFDQEDLFHKKEYALLMCNSPCNDVKKVIIRKEIRLDEQQD